MILVRVSIRDRMPAKIDMVQFPRNFFTPIDNTNDMWLFHVYGLEGFPGLHYYFQQVFDVDLDGIFYVHLDNFVPLFDGLFPDGVEIPGTTRDAGLYTWTDGEAILKFLRDNDNNWGCPEYDCGDRQMRVITQIGFSLKEMVKDDPVNTLLALWEIYSGLVVTDLSTIEQIEEGIVLLANLIDQDFQLNFWKLTEADGVKYGEGNLDVRGFGITDHSAMLEWLWTRLR
jgi:anionic cell wall polymer biosynthesis LytR-Cps2A-Psr (LCP) family protein